MNNDQALINVFADVVDGLACEIDANYENEDLGLLATDDSTFVNFRRADPHQAHKLKSAGSTPVHAADKS